MGEPKFFVVYEDDIDEHRLSIQTCDSEEGAVKLIYDRYEASKQEPRMVIRGEVLSVDIHTTVRFVQND